MALGGLLGAKDILIQLKGDNRNFKSSLDDTDKSMGKFTDSVLKAGPAMAAAFAVGTAALVASSVQIASAEEAVDRQTESMLKSQGIMWSSVKDEVAGYIDELEALTAYGDTDLQMAFNRMSSSGMGYTETMESMKMVTDIAYTKNIDLVSAADLVAKAYNGQGSALKRYGIVLEEGLTGLEAVLDMQEKVNKSFADAADRTESLEGKTENLANIYDDFAGNLGREVIPELSDFANLLGGSAKGAEELGTFLGRLIAMPIKLPRQLFEHVDIMKDLNQLRDEGVDTEEEMIEHLGLHNENLAEMNDEIFKYNMKLLTAARFHERTLKLDDERVYAIEEQNSALENQALVERILLDIEERKTKEGEKQLSTMRERAAAKREDIQRARTTGTSLTGLSGSAAAYAAGEAYTRQSGAITITNPGKSGAP